MKKAPIFIAVITAVFWLSFTGDVSAQPRPTRDQVGELSFMNGSWLATPSSLTPDGEWQEKNYTGFVNFEFTLDRNMIEGDLSPLPDLNIHSRMFITYDVVRGFYRVLSLDDYWGWVLIMTGQLDDDGSLEVTNVGTSTSWRTNQGRGWTNTRMRFERVDDNHVRIVHELSNDGGETWENTERLDLKRRYEQ